MHLSWHSLLFLPKTITGPDRITEKAPRQVTRSLVGQIEARRGTLPGSSLEPIQRISHHGGRPNRRVTRRHSDHSSGSRASFGEIASGSLHWATTHRCGALGGESESNDAA